MEIERNLIIRKMPLGMPRRRASFFEAHYLMHTYTTKDDFFFV